MRTHFSSPWVVCFVCLTAVACLRSLDGDKIPCTSSEHCPSRYTCLDGYCSRGSTVDSGRPSDAVAKGDGPRAERGEAGLTKPDSATTPAENPDALVPGGAGGAGGGGTSGVVGATDVDGGSGLTSDAPVSTVATIGGSTTGGLTAGSTTLGTNGAAGTGGVTSSTSSKTGGAVVTSSGAAGAGGVSATSSAINSSSKAGASAGATTVTGGASSSSAGGVSASGGATGTVTTSANPCAGVTCNNHGTCSGAGVCTCTDGWSGARCTTDPCASITCNNHGTCSEGTCTCTDGWTGAACTVNPCTGVTCNNHGTCSGNAVCTCTGGWSGPGCTVDPCTGVTCNNHGTCSGNAVCTCTGGWSGQGCTIDPCAGVTCSGHGTCSAGTCSCNQGWSGLTCANAVPPTLSGPLDVTICNKYTTPTAVFSVNASGAAGGPYQYQWFKMDDPSGTNSSPGCSACLGDTTSTLTQQLDQRGSPGEPSKSYYNVVVNDPKNGGRTTSRVATLWLAKPWPFHIEYHRDNNWPTLSVQIDIPISGCIAVYFSTNKGASYSFVKRVCAGDFDPWTVVGTINTSDYASNLVKTVVEEYANGITCVSDEDIFTYPGP